AVTYPMPDIKQRLETFFEMASERGLDADFHADETGDPTSATLRAIAETVLKTGYDAPVTVGHCCSLAVQDDGEAERTLNLVAEAGLNIVSLPLCNLYLQARESGRTPRWRGVTLVHEMRARGINVSFASDNTRDPFYAYGDLDMVEVVREATRIAHLDHSATHWLDAFSANPASACGFASNALESGNPADFVIFKARSMTEFLARPQTDRLVVRRGRAIDRSLPDYSDLDHLMVTQPKSETTRMTA
ncbi:MAG: amidohydrolase family protein, partial [Pseudomonadota bacterium]